MSEDKKVVKKVWNKFVNQRSNSKESSNLSRSLDVETISFSMIPFLHSYAKNVRNNIRQLIAALGTMSDKRSAKELFEELENKDKK